MAVRCWTEKRTDCQRRLQMSLTLKMLLMLVLLTRATSPLAAS